METSISSYTLSNLLPGTLYEVTVVTEAVGLQSSVSQRAVTGTCPSPFFNRDVYLYIPQPFTLTWNHPISQSIKG